MKPEHPSHGRDVPGGGDPDARGAPVGRRVLLGTLGLGALGLAAAPSLQRGLESLLAGAPTATPPA